METPWEQSWERSFLVERNGPTFRERCFALTAITLASAGFLVTVIWPVVEALR
jgi:hypothetical protein